ncbi:MAG: OmpH family outer membrane protein [Oxalobacter sp.]|nr:MAG: OmpH family outer membrane protein [Oxalobacter sp.]
MTLKSKIISTTRIIVVLTLGLFSTAVLHAESLRIGHVSSARVMREAVPAKEADAKIKKEFSKREKELMAMSKKLKDKAAKFEKDAPVLTDSDRTKRQKELVEMDQALQQKHKAFRQDLAQRRNEEGAAFGKQLQAAIKKIALAEKLDIIVQDALYYDPKIDVTNKVLEELNN